MRAMQSIGAAASVCLMGSMALAQSLSPNGVKTLAPQGAIQTTGTWNVGTRAGDFIYIAGMRGIDPKSNTLVAGDEARIRQGFRNMQLIAESEGASLRDCVRIVVYVTDMFRFRPHVNKVQEELWGQGPYPPRTIVEVHRLNQDDIFEVEMNRRDLSTVGWANARERCFSSLGLACAYAHAEKQRNARLLRRK
jgi:2-iminobutanoate/2-iminopropanoate deaminase